MVFRLSKGAINGLPLPFEVHCSRRAYTAAAENLSAASAIKKAAEPSKEVAGEAFWMRDPKTENWIPENRFNEIDAAELRQEFLSKKDKL
ncbi:hypothetical protein RJ639_043935 [Escallonia herrerae]|uniref:Late embryogenesis abundant protein n=1 Tax=Escallonia herrerae TaxID=1293975 RepID=A0AA89B472_9ASTE|nr:hypothetical protein RJ639_043935 [Escallonia herrerae]